MSRQTWFFSLDSVKSGLRILASDGVITQTGQSAGSARAGDPGVGPGAGPAVDGVSPSPHRSARPCDRAPGWLHALQGHGAGFRAAAGGCADPVRRVRARRAGQAAGRRHLCVSRSGTADAGDLRRDSAARSLPIWLYRYPKASDLEIQAEERPIEAIRLARLPGLTAGGFPANGHRSAPGRSPAVG